MNFFGEKRGIGSKFLRNSVSPIFLRFNFRLTFLSIHSGDSCATNEEVGGHYYGTSDDPWTNAVFVVTSGTDATGALQVEFGQTYDNSMGKAFVV